MTCTVTGWPTVSTSAGRDAALKPISDAGSSPSMPPTSTNAPKSLSAGHHARQHRAHDELAARLDGAAPRLFLEQRAPRQHDVGAAAILLVARDPELSLRPT